MTEQHLTEEEYEQLLEKFVRNKLAMEELAVENDQIKGYFKQTTLAPNGEPVYGTETHGKFYIQRSRNARTDPKLAAALFADRDIWKQTVDTAKAKKVLSGDEYEAIQNVFEPKIEIGMV
jgi:hypothetical protein